MEWIKSSFCDSASCVEVAFVKSSKSGSNGACVEVAACDCHVKVRDSKDPGGAVLTFTHQEWDALLKRICAIGMLAIHDDTFPGLTFTHEEILAFCGGVVAGEFDRAPA